MSFKCDKCNRSFNLKHHLINHLNKKNPCNINNNNNIKNDSSYNEEIKEKKEITELKDLFIKETQKLYLIIDKQQKIIEQLQNNNKIDNTTNILSNNIVAFGNEDYKKLSNFEIKKILFNQKINPLLEIIGYIHFNDRLYQQHNIRYNNLKSKVINIYDGENWKTDNLNNILDNLLENNIRNLNKIYEMIADEFKLNINKDVRCIIDNYNEYNKLNIENKLDKNNKIIKFISKIKDDIKLSIYIKTRNFKIK